MKKILGLSYIKSYLSKLKLRKNNRSFGYVEMISPNLISGWVLDKKTKFVEVRLIDDDKVLASAPINIYRKDVATKFNNKVRAPMFSPNVGNIFGEQKTV